MNLGQFLPPYIEPKNGGVIGYPPMKSIGNDLFGFIFCCKGSNPLQQVISEWINGPFYGGRKYYKPLFPLVAVLFNRYNPGGVIDQGRQQGVVPYEELVISIFVRRGRLCGFWKRLYMFSPYLILDAPVPLLNGREVYGMPKVGGKLEISDYNWPKLAPQSMTSVVTCDPKARLSIKSPYKDNTIGKPIVDRKEAFNQFFSELENASDVNTRNAEQLRKEMNKNSAAQIISMLQFRDISQPNLACTKSLISFSGEVNYMKGLQLLKARNYTLELNNTPTFDIGRYMGLESGQKPVMAFWLNYGLQTGKGKTLKRKI